MHERKLVEAATAAVVIDDGDIMLMEDTINEPVLEQPAAGVETAAPEVADVPSSADTEEARPASAENGAEKPDPNWVINYPSVAFEIDLPMFAPGKSKLPKAIKDYYRSNEVGTMNQPMEATMGRFSEMPDVDEKNFEMRYQDLMVNCYPFTDKHERMSRKDSIWTNFVVAEGKDTRPVGVRPTGAAVTDIFRAQNSLGQPTEWRFYNTGIVIKMRPPLDSELVGLDQIMLQDRTELGQKTYGTVLSADMGIHTLHLVDFALEHVTWTNMEHEGDIVSTLRQYLRGRESVEVLINAMLASMYPHGYPWTISCHALDCDATEEEDLYFARCAVTEKTMLTEKHFNILHRNSKQLPFDKYVEYLDDLEAATKDFEYNGTVFKLRLPSIGDYAASTRRWVDVIEVEHAAALAKIDHPNQREKFIEAQTASRALLAYSHYVGSITITNGDAVTEVIERERIEEILHAASSDMQLTALFVEAVTQFELDSRTTFIGHKNSVCKTCGSNIRTVDGPWDTLVPLPIERIFFTHMRQKIQMLYGLRSRL